MRQRKLILLESIERRLTKGCSSLSRLRRIIISIEPGMDWEEHTLAIDPQKRASGFPFREHPATKEPLSGSIMLDSARDAVVR